MLEDPFFEGSHLDAATLMAGLAAWSLLMGALSAEVFGQLGADTVAEPASYFEYVLEVGRRLVLHP
jgi:hypothetical protein